MKLRQAAVALAVIASFSVVQSSLSLERMTSFKIKQAINIPALKMLRNVIADPSIAVPCIELNSLEELSFANLKHRGVKYIVYDKDNTLCDKLPPNVQIALYGAQVAFGNSALSILSNSVGTSDDLDHAMARKTEAALGLPVIRHRTKKPDCLNEVLAHYEAAVGERVSPHQICVIGDRLLTDVVFANRHGLVSVLVAPLSHTQDHPVAVLLRWLERSVLLPLIKGLGYKAPAASDIVKR